MSVMGADRGRRATRALAAAACLLALAGLAYTLLAHTRVRSAGRADLSSDLFEAVVYGAALVSAATVGLIVAVRQRRHPVGWLFLGLAVWLGVGGAGDAYALLGTSVGRDRRRPRQSVWPSKPSRTPNSTHPSRDSTTRGR